MGTEVLQSSVPQAVVPGLLLNVRGITRALEIGGGGRKQTGRTNKYKVPKQGKLPASQNGPTLACTCQTVFMLHRPASNF